jgi:hypothetical protein
MALVTNNISGSAGSRIGITGSVIFANEPGNEFPPMPGTDVTFFVSGSSTERSVFGGTTVVSGTLFVDGDTYIGDAITDKLIVSASTTILGDSFEITGSLSVTGGISGSLTRLTNGTSYLVAGGNMLVVTGSNGSITLSTINSGTIHGVTAGTGLTGGGTSNTVTLNINDSVVATVSGSTFTGATKFNSGLSGSLTHLSNGTSYLVASGATTITSNSNGSITIYAPSSTTPGGSSGEVQFNNAGVFSGSSLFTYNPTVGAVTASYFIGNGGGLTQLTASQVYVSGAVDVIGYLQFQPVGNVVLPADKTAGYMYVSGSTNDIYFTQFQPGSNYNNTTRLRWLEGMLTTGLLHGGVLSTQAGTTTFSITSGSGIIVSYNASTSSDPYPTINFISWPTYLSQSLTYVTSSQITYIGINPSGGLIQQTSPFTLSADSDFISIGRVLHQSGSVTNGTSTQPIVAYGTNHWQDDFTRAFGPLKISGHVLAASSSAGVGTLGLTKTGGDSYVIGKNYAVNPSNPNNITSATDPAVTVSKIYRAYVSGSTLKLDTGVGNAGYTTIDPTVYNDNGTLTSVGGANASIQRVYWYPNSVARAYTVYYGSQTYADPPGGQNALDNAQQNIASEPFVEGENTVGAAILVGYILVKGDATDLTNTAKARIIQAGISRGAGAGGGGGVAVGPTSPGGLDTYVQFNDGGSTFGGDSGLTYNKTTDVLTIGNISIGDTGVVSTTGTSISLFNSTATTVNFAGGATSAINVGNSSGTNTVSGSTTFANPAKFSQGLSGSHTKLTDGTSAFIAGGNMSLSTGSNGAVTFSTINSGTIHGVTAGTGLTGGGTSGTVTLNINDSVVATVSGSTFTGAAKFNAGLSGSHTKLVDGTSAFIADGNMSIVTGSNGALTFTAIPAGSTTQVQYNDGGSFAGSLGFTFDKTTTSLNVTGDITGSNLRLTGDAAVVGGDLTSTSTTFNLVNSSVTTVNIGGGASTVNIGGSTTTGSISGDLTVSGRSNLGTVVENILTSNGGTGTVAFSLSGQSVFYAKAPTGNITANFTNVPATSGKVISTTVILSQSSPAYIVSAVQIDGVAQTLNWVNGTVPSGTANKHDVFGFSLIRSGSIPTWVVLGQMSTYG